MDLRLREIAGQPAGTYFIVNDNTTQSDVVPSSNLRVVFVNTELGNPNVATVFRQGDIAGFNAVYGKQSRKKEKQGNFSISTVEAMLQAGPVVVINLRKFDSDLDTIQVSGISPNKTLEETIVTSYESVFNRNGFWTFKGENLPKLLRTENLLNFANIGSGTISYFVTPAKSVDQLTTEGENNLVSTILEVEAYPALTDKLLVKDTFVDVWIFKNDLSKVSVTNNQYYGQLFNETGLIDQEMLETLSLMPESGFARKVTGSVIPYLKSETNEDLSIDVLLNQFYLETGLACYLNDDVLEFETVEDLPTINLTGEGYYTETGAIVDDGNLLSYRLQPITNLSTVDVDATKPDLTNYNNELLLKVEGDIFPVEGDAHKVYALFENGIRVGDLLDSYNLGEVQTSIVTKIEVAEEFSLNSIPTINSLKVTYDNETPNTVTFDLPVTALEGLTKVPVINGQVAETATVTDLNLYSEANPLKIKFNVSKEGYADKTTVTALVFKVPGIPTPIVEYVNEVTEAPRTWMKVILTTDRPVYGDYYIRRKNLTTLPKLKLVPTTIKAYVPREEQFTNGSAIRQNEILDIMNSPAIRKGLKNFVGVRYLVDAFKSFVEPNYKYQFGILNTELQEKCNKFVNSIINEPFIEDLDNSKNPLFKETPNGILDLGRYLSTGGNKDFSTTLLTKFTTGAQYCYFFGVGNVVRSVTYPGAGEISQNFINKAFPWDIIANETGYVDGITSLEINPDDEERGSMEKFRWNPIIIKGDGYAIYGNLTGQRSKSALQEIHNAELLSYIKESLYNISLTENFKKGTYNEYLSFQTEVQSFMNNLALNGAIKANPVVKCDLENNTTEVQRYKIKLVRIEYENITALDKVVFELNLN